MAKESKKKLRENLKEMKGGELEKKLLSLQAEVRGIRFKAEGSRSKDVKEMANLKKQIARVMTHLNAAK